MTHKSTEGIGIEDVRQASQSAGKADAVVRPDVEPIAVQSEYDEEYDSHNAKIALGVGALGLMGIATAIAYRNLRKQHKEGK